MESAVNHFHRAGEPRVFHRSRRPYGSEPAVEPQAAIRFLQRSLPESWRFAHQMSLDLLRQIEPLAWPDRADAFDTYFVRQAEVMLRPEGLTDLVNGAGPPAPRPSANTREAIDRFAVWTRSLVTSVLVDLDEAIVVCEADEALTYILSRDFMRARAAVRWTGRHGLEAIAEALERLPGYALVLLASSRNDSAERFLARDAFWTAVRRAQG